jgi:hypothetical protein
MPGVMWSSHAGSCTLKGYSTPSFACFILPLRRTNCLLEVWPVCQHMSSAVPTPEVQALSATVEGIELSSMLLWRRLSLTPRMFWHGGGRLLSVALATVSGLHEVATRRSCCLLIRHIHHCVILLTISGGIVGWGKTGESLGLCSLTWHSSRDRQA